MGTRTFPVEDAMAKTLSTPLATEIKLFVDAQHRLRPKTRSEYQRSLERFDAHLGHGCLRDLTPRNVNAYITLKVEAGAKYIARNDMATLKVFAKWLVQAKHLTTDPLVSVEVPKVPQKGRAPFHDRDIAKIMEAASGSRLLSCQHRDRLIVQLAMWTGMRLNELRMLRWPDDIDLREKMLFVRASKTDAGIRSIPLDDQILAAIEAYVHSYRPGGPGPLFLNQHGEPFTYHGFARVQGRIHERLAGSGIDYKIHRLRNTWAAKTRSIGWDVLDIQQVGGWTDLAMVRRYAGNKSNDDLRKLPSMTTAFGRGF